MDSIGREITGRRPGRGGIEPLGLSIRQTAEITGESEWTVKQKLRNGTYKAKKSGRRTIIVYQSVVAHWNSLPDAKFCKPLRRKLTQHLESGSL
jgi:hypothetical protein